MILYTYYYNIRLNNFTVWISNLRIENIQAYVYYFFKAVVSIQ